MQINHRHKEMYHTPNYLVVKSKRGVCLGDEVEGRFIPYGKMTSLESARMLFQEATNREDGPIALAEVRDSKVEIMAWHGPIQLNALDRTMKNIKDLVASGNVEVEE